MRASTPSFSTINFANIRKAQIPLPGKTLSPNAHVVLSLRCFSQPDLTYVFVVYSLFHTPAATNIALVNYTIAPTHKHPSKHKQHLPLNVGTCHIPVLLIPVWKLTMTIPPKLALLLVYSTTPALPTYHTTAALIQAHSTQHSWSRATSSCTRVRPSKQASTLINAIILHDIHFKLHTNSRGLYEFLVCTKATAKKGFDHQPLLSMTSFWAPWNYLHYLDTFKPEPSRHHYRGTYHIGAARVSWKQFSIY